MENSAGRKLVIPEEVKVPVQEGDKSHPAQEPLYDGEELDEKKLIERIHSGEHAAFNSLVRSQYANLCDYAFGYTRSKPDAEEIVQELFVKLWEKRDTWNPATTIKAYLFRAVRNLCLNHLRDQSNRRDLLVIAGDTSESLYQSDLHYMELTRVLRKLIADLPERRREIFLLNRFHGLSYAEVAEALEISINTVDTQIRRALDYLRAHLAAYLD